MFTIPDGGAIANGSRKMSMPGMEAPDPAAWYACLLYTSPSPRD